jgi:hypothetical protein
VRGVARERRGARGGEDLVVPPPDREHRHLRGAEPLVHRRVQLAVGRVVAEQRQLHVVLARSGEECEVVLPGVGVDGGRVRHAVGVLPFDGFPAEGGTERVARLGGAFGGVGPDRVPEAGHEALFVGVAVLGDDADDGSGVGECQTPADRRAVVLDVDRVLRHADGREEPAGHVGEGREGVLELVDRGGGGATEADVVRSDDAVAVGQGGDEVAEHVRAARVPVQKQEHGGVGGARFAVEDVEPIDGDGAVVDGDHC